MVQWAAVGLAIAAWQGYWLNWLLHIFCQFLRSIGNLTRGVYFIKSEEIQSCMTDGVRTARHDCLRYTYTWSQVGHCLVFTYLSCCYSISLMTWYICWRALSLASCFLSASWGIYQHLLFVVQELLTWRRTRLLRFSLTICGLEFWLDL